MASTKTLQEDYDTLKTNLKRLEYELDDKSQQVHNYKKQLALATALEGDYLQEIEALQSLNTARVEKFQKANKQLEVRLATLREASDSELLKKADLIEGLQSQIQEYVKNACKEVQSKNDCDDAEAEKNQLLKEEISMLTYKLVDIQMRMDSLQNQNLELEEHNHNLHSDLEEAQQNLTYKIQELKQTTNLKQSLKEDIFLVKLDLDSLKSKPLDLAQQGNSLFGEVEDSRIKMQKNIEQTKKSYTEMKRSVYPKLKKIAVLRSQNLELVRQLEMLREHDDEYDGKIKEYESEISILEATVNEYKQEIMKVPKLTGKDLPNYMTEFANNTIRSQWTDIEAAGENLNSISRDKLKTFIEIQSTGTTMRSLRRKAQKVKVKIEELESSILEIQLQNTPACLTESQPQDVKDKPQDQQKCSSGAALKRNSSESKSNAPVATRTANKVRLGSEGQIKPSIFKIEPQLRTESVATRESKSSTNLSTSIKDEKEVVETESNSVSGNTDKSGKTEKIVMFDAASVESTPACKTPRNCLKIEANEVRKSLEFSETGVNITSNSYCEEPSVSNSMLFVNDAGHTPAVNRHRIGDNSSDCTIFNDTNNQNDSLAMKELHCENYDDSLLFISNTMQMLALNDRGDVGNTLLMNDIHMDTIYEESYCDDQEQTFNNLKYVNNAGHTPAPKRKQKIMDYYTLTTPDCTAKTSPELNADDDSTPINSNGPAFVENRQILNNSVNKHDFKCRRSRMQSENEGSLLQYMDDTTTMSGNDSDVTLTNSVEDPDVNVKRVSSTLKFECSTSEDLSYQENVSLVQSQDSDLSFISKGMTDVKIMDISQQEYRTLLSQGQKVTKKSFPNNEEFVNGIIIEKRKTEEQINEYSNEEYRARKMMSLQRKETTSKVQEWKKCTVQNFKIETSSIADIHKPILEINKNNEGCSGSMKTTLKVMDKREGKLSDECDKENSIQEANVVNEKKVKFTVDTVDPKPSNKHPLRKGGKILQCKTVHIPSITNKK